MIRVTLIPNTVGAGGPRVFETNGAIHRLQAHELELQLRDGKVCIQVLGDWQVTYTASSIVAYSCAEVERIHNGETLIVM